MVEWKEYNYRMYDELHCPFCGSTDIQFDREGFSREDRCLSSTYYQ